MRKFGLIVLLLAFSLTATAKGFKKESETKVFADSLMTQFIKGDFAGALNKAKVYWPLPAIEIDGMLNKINQQWPLNKRSEFLSS